MATSSDSNQGVRECTAFEAELRVSAYDKVASVLIALLIVTSFFVLAMLTIWLTGNAMTTNVSRPVDRLEDEGREDHAPGFALDMEEPGMEEMEELKEPQIEDALAAITDVVTSQAAVFDAIESTAAVSSRGIGPGDRRRIGPPGRPIIDDVIPPHKRWEIRFSTLGIETYARQLDFFKIELGAVGGGSPKVDYAYNVTKSKPDQRSGKSEDEGRLYMSWRKDGGPMSAFDRQLLARAGVKTQHRVILQFYPEEIEDLLSDLEAQGARDCGHTDPRAFMKTIFGVRSVRDEYVFFVIDQYFRPVPTP